MNNNVLSPVGASRTSASARWTLFVLVLIYGSNFADRILVATVGQAMKVEMGLTDLQLGLLGGMAFALFYTVLGLPMARLSERYSRVKIVAACVAMWSLMTALCGVAQSYAQLLLFRVGVGVGEAGSTPASHSLIADHFPPHKRGLAFAVFGLGVPLGAFIGAILGGWIVQNIGWREAFIYLGVPGLLLSLLALFTLREPPRGGADVDVDAAAPTAGAQPGEVPPLSAVLRLLWSKRTFIHLTLGCSLVGFANMGINMFMPIYYSRVFGMSYAQAGLTFGLITGIGAMLGHVIGGYVADWAGKRDPRWYLWVVAIGLVIAAPLYMLAFMQTHWAAAAVMMLVFGSILYLWYGPTFAVAYSLVGPRMRASSSALILLTISLIGHGLGPVFMGFVSDLAANHAFSGGEFSEVCKVASNASPLAAELASACSAASATGIRHAAVVSGLFFLWGAFHYYRASRTLKKDMLQQQTPAAA